MTLKFDVLWQDRDLRFDSNTMDLNPRSGEKVIDKLDSVEDTKGNNGEQGRLIITNLRVIWYCQKSPNINLSIGLGCVISMTVKTAQSVLRGQTEALYVMTKSGQTRYEFIFTNLIAGSPRLFTSAISVHRAYESSRLYREVRQRGALINNRQLQLLPLEQLTATFNGVWNLAADQGHLGTFIITNVRVVWFGNMNENFNISIPYIHIVSVKLCDSKFGQALVLTTSQQSGGFILGFRISPSEKLGELRKLVSSMQRVYGSSPVFGVEFRADTQAPKKAEDKAEASSANESRVVDDVEIDSSAENRDTLSAYLADAEPSPDGTGETAPETADRFRRGFVLSCELALAIEPLREGYTLADLWDVFPRPPSVRPRGVPGADVVAGDREKEKSSAELLDPEAAQ